MSAAPSRRAPIGLLVVEDSVADSRLLAESLRDVAGPESAVVRVVRCLADARTEMQRYSFTCVLLDLNLPDGQGVHNVEVLRDIDRSVAIVVLTGTDDDRIAAEAIRLGAQEYLVKGQFDGAKILRLLHHAIERNRQLHQLEDERHREFQRASHDSLTGLANRDLLYERLQQLIVEARASGESFALCYLDLDGFKTVNDRHGHRVGDELLVRVAQVLSESVPVADSVSRLGGDEFLVLLRAHAGELDAGGTARSLREKLAAIRQIGEYSIDLDASIGVVIFPQHGASIEQLMERADQAMYEAKRGGGGVVFYDATLALSAPERIAGLRVELGEALDKNQFSLRYHPWVDVAARRFAGVEVLLRWERDGGVQGPDDFIRAAAASGQGGELAMHVALKAFRQLHEWNQDWNRDWPRDAGLLPLLSLNITESELADERYLMALGTAASSSGIDPRQIRLEVPMTALGGDRADRALAQLRRARGEGFGVVLDQFGPDGEAFRWLTALPWEGVKIGRHVLRALHEEGMHGPMQRFIVAVIGAGRHLQLPVIVTGVETIDERLKLETMGCTLMQGQLFSAAESLRQLPERLHRGPDGFEPGFG